MTLIAWLAGCAPDLSSPAPIPYDHVACDHCGMLISDPRFAAQLATRDGERHEFDDPACLFLWIVDHEPALAGAWFSDSSSADGDVWLSYREVGFIEAKGSPMGGGLGAVPEGTAGAISFGAASSRAVGGRK